MALFSFRHSTRTFSPKRTSNERAAEHGQTAAHLAYITRSSAANVVLRARVAGTDTEAARAAEHAAEKRGGRVAERFIVALPREASAEQRVALAQSYAEALTRGVAGYVLAIHDAAGNDASNPHCHLVAFDAHERGGGRGRPRSVLGMARKGAIEAAAALWAETHNRLMREWGNSAACDISHLSFAAQGIDRAPTIHEGAGARAMTRRGERPKAKPEWRAIDGGATRAEANALIGEINKLATGDDNGRGNGLGGGDDRDARERNEGRHDGGADTWRSCRDVGGVPPFLAGGGDAGAARPAGGGGGGVERGAARRPDPTGGPGAFPPFVAPDGRSGGGRGLAGLRRVFVELLMLRDTLRAQAAQVAERWRQSPRAAPSRPVSQARRNGVAR